MSSFTDLTITNKKQQPLNKQQQAFNKLVKKIEQLRMKIKKTSETLDKQLDFYTKEINPEELKLVEKTKDLVKLYYDIHQNKKFLTQQEKKLIKEMMAAELDFILSMESNPDDELKAIYQFANGETYEDSIKEQFEEMKGEMESMFNSFGMDIDLSDIDPETGQEELARRLKMMQEELQNKQEQNNWQDKPRKKTVKQLEKEEKGRKMEEARNKNISTIYRQLAKAFHPDLEQDVEKKAEKEVLMKQLTSAYEANDLHTLLKLELEWIHREEEHVNELTNEKLTIYNAVLKEQVQELEQERFMILQHPRYMALNKYLSPFDEDVTKVDLRHEKHEITMGIGDLEQSLAQLKGPNGLKEIKDRIKMFKMQGRMGDMDFDIFSEIFKAGKVPF